MSGGAARALVHIGFLKAIEEEEIFPDVIAGTSMGGIVAILYAKELSYKYVYDTIKNSIDKGYFEKLGFDVFSNKERNIFSRIYDAIVEKINTAKAFLSESVIDPEVSYKASEEMFGNITFDDLKIDTFVTSFDLIKGEYVVINKGYIKDAIIATSAIPGFLPPLKKKGQILVDGGIISNTPVKFLKNLYSPKIIIASRVRNEIDYREDLRGGFEYYQRILQYHRVNVEKEELKFANIILTFDPRGLTWADFHKFEEFVNIGYYNTKEYIKKIKRKIMFRKFFFFL